MTMVKRKNRRKKWLAIIIVIAILAVVLVGGFIILRNRTYNPLANVRTVTVATGDLEKTVTGSGNLSSEDVIEDILVPDGLLLDEVLVKAGDRVEDGDWIARFNPYSLQTAIWNTQTDINNLDQQLNRLKDNTEDDYIRTPLGGRIKQIFASEGDLVRDVMSQHGALLLLSLDGKMKVELELDESVSLQVGDSVTVTLSDGTKEDGLVHSVRPDQLVVTLSDQTAPVNDQVSVAMTDGSVLGSGSLGINEPLALTATDGQISTVRYHVGDQVSSDWRIFRLTEAPVSQAYSRLYIQREDAASRLAELIRYSQTGSLLADRSGEILVLKISANQTTGGMNTSGMNTTGSSTALTLLTSRETRLTVSVDELDIPLLSEGQPVKITIQALPTADLAGSILKIAKSGTISQGGAAYAVTVQVPELENLKLGMSATAVITVDERDDVVLIPLEALQELGGEQFVYVGEAVSATNLGERRPVVTGISDGEFVEIISGLSADEKVNYIWNTGTNPFFPFRGGNTGSSR